MKKHLNTLYITTQGTLLRARGETIKVSVEGEHIITLPLRTLEQIICLGRVSITSPLISACANNGVNLTLLTETGRFVARVEGPIRGNVILRLNQYNAAEDDNRSSDLARTFILAKIANTRTLLLRTRRDHPEIRDNKQVDEAIMRMANMIQRLRKVDNVDRIRGIEGEAAKTYFSIFDNLILNKESGFRFTQRIKHPPTDAVNAMLSFAYSMLTNDARSALEAVGLDPQLGFLHKTRPGRPSLALDVIEEFRSFIADRLVLSLINRGQVGINQFEDIETGEVYMKDKARKQFIRYYQQRKNDEIKHPFLKEKTTIGMLLHLQAALLARHLRGDLEKYPPFLIK